MAFKGTLKEFKVPDILQLISLQKKTGILTFTSKDGFITLIFEEGMIVGVDSFPKKLETRVGHVLVKQDYISDEMLQRALTIQKRTNQKIGEILIGMGLIGKDTIGESLKTQAIEIILSLFKWKRGEYNFKVIAHLDPTIKIIDPIPTDNLIMEGVQMLDEWPLIKNKIHSELLVFEPIQVQTRDIEIIDEYEEESESGRSGKIYLSETEANLLKYINGKNTVIDLVELGIFTEYKVYKSLFNLINKNIIRVREEPEAVDSQAEPRMLELNIEDSTSLINKLFYTLVALLIILFIWSFSHPLKPLHPDNVLMKDSLYQEFLVSSGSGSDSTGNP